MSVFKSGFVVICGRPNVGKSTLMNKMIGQKIAIVSPKPQTTRNTIRGILTGDDFQIVFLDTPGIHKPKSKLNEYMAKSQKEANSGADVIVIMLDATEPLGRTDIFILESYKNYKTPIIVLVNKIDLIDNDALYNFLASLSQFTYPYAVIPISAEKEIGVEVLQENLLELLPQGPKYFPDDMVCDFPERFLASELIREKALILLNQEIPHGIGVNITKMEENEGRKLLIQADVFCERDSHKGIIIGKGGSMLRQIGEAARIELQELLETEIYLELYVKVKENWRNSGAALKELGYHD